MSYTTTLDIEKIDSALSSFADTERTIFEGSDEHLDLILDIQNGLTQNASCTEALVAYIESNFNKYSTETAQELIAKVFPCFGLARRVIEALKASPVYNEVKSYLADFEAEISELFEITNDLSRYKVHGTNDYNSLF